MTLISSDNTWAIWTVMVACVALGVWLEGRYRWAAKMSALVIILLLAIVLSNINILPSESGVYDAVWDYLVPLALPMLLFRADLKKIFRESGQMLIAFLIGALGSVVGAVLAFLIFRNLIPEIAGLAAMFTGTYTGGSVNFAALSRVFNVSGEMVSAGTIADNLNMAIYFFVLLSIPVKNRMEKENRTEKGGFPDHGISGSGTGDDRTRKKGSDHPENGSKETGSRGLSLKNLSICIAAAFIIVLVSTGIANLIGGLFPESTDGFSSRFLLEMLGSFLGNRYLWITTVSVACATLWPQFFGRIEGTQEIGTYMIYCFMFVIGAPASVMGIIRNSPLLLLVAMLVVIFNMVFTFAGGALLHLDRDLLIIASNANVGGPTTAASMAIAKGWDDLVGPALLIGSLGYVIGNYLGMMVGYLCMGL